MSLAPLAAIYMVEAMVDTLARCRAQDGTRKNKSRITDAMASLFMEKVACELCLRTCI
jgi:hypothetical protein